jgi:hypothetical protein
MDLNPSESAAFPLQTSRPIKTWVKANTGYFPEDLLRWLLSRGYRCEILAHMTPEEVEEDMCRARGRDGDSSGL